MNKNILIWSNNSGNEEALTVEIHSLYMYLTYCNIV